MNITHVTLRYSPASGGVEDYVQDLVERLRAAGDDVTVETTALRTHHPATFLPSPIADQPYVHRHPVRTFGPIAYPLPVSLSSALARLPALPAEASRPAKLGERSGMAKAGPTLVHAHGFWYAPADIAARAAKRRGIPFVLNPYYAPRAKPLWRLYRRFIGAHTLAAADAVVVISPQEEALLRADGFALKRVELIPPGIDPAEFAKARPNPFAARGIRDKHVLFFAGRIARAKGIDLLLHAFRVILSATEDPARSVRLAIAGEDFGERREFKQLADRLGVSRAVTWLGKLPREELLAAYQHADVFAFPSRYEAFGISPLEAQAAGCPVVATNTSALPFIVQHEKTGLLFRREDPADVAAQILRLLRDEPLVTRLAAAARDRAHAEFTWDRSVTKLRALYAELVH